MLSRNQFGATAIIATVAIAVLLTFTLLQTNQPANETQTAYETTNEQNQYKELTDENQNTASLSKKEENTSLSLTKKSETAIILSSGNKKALITFHSLENNELKEMPKEALFSIDSTKLSETGYKWGYHFRLPSQGFTAAALVESESEITILDEQKGELLLDFTEISFADVLEFGFSVETKKIASNKVLVKMIKDYANEGIKAGEFVYIDPVATLVTEPVSIESTSNSLKPAIAVDDTNIYIAWTDSTNYADSGTDSDIFFKTRSRTGNWTDVPTQVVSTESTVTSDYSSIAVDDTNIYITWHDNGGGANVDISFKTKSKTGGLASNNVNWLNATETVSTESGGCQSFNPVIAVDDTNIYIAWNEYGGYYNVFFKTRKKTDSWGTNTEVVSKESEFEFNFSSMPAMVVDDTNIYIAWYDNKDYNGSGTDRDIFFKTRSMTGNWTDVPTQVVSTESTSYSRSPTITVDDSNIYIAWRDPTDYGGAGTDDDVFFKTRSKTGGLASNDVNWSMAAQVVSTESTGSSYGPKIVVDDSNIYITWYDPTNYAGAGTDRDIFFKTKGKTDALGSNDINWSSAAVVVSTESTGDSSWPDLNVYGGTVYITWYDATDFNGTDTDIVFRSFSPPTLPSVSITAPSAGSYYSGTITVSATASDDSGVQDVTFYYTPGGGTGFTGTLVCSDDSSPYSCNWDSTAVADANYQIKAIVTASNGDKEPDFMSSPFGVDNSPPTTVDNDFNNTWQNTDANIQFNCSDDGGGCKNFYYSVDDSNSQQSWGSGDQNIGIVLDWDGNHEIFYWSDDITDNNENAHLIYLAIDKSTPTTLATDYNNLWQNTDANIQFSCSDSSAGDQNAGCRNLYYSLDDINYQLGWGIDQNIGIEITWDGNHEIFYWSDDNTSGIGDNNEAAHLIYLAIDKIVPSTIDNDYNNTWQNTDANIQFSCSDVNGGCRNFYYSLDDVNYQLGWGIGDENIGVVLNTDLNHEIFYWSDSNTTGIGDNNETAHLIYLAIDKTAPTVSISSPSNGSTQTSSTITLQYTGNDATSGIAKYYVKADGSWIDNSTSTSYTFSSQSAGSHTYCAKAEDNASNTTETCTNTTLSFGGSWGIMGIGPQARPTETRQILMLEKEFVPLAEAGIPVLDQTEKQLELQYKRFATAGEVTLIRGIRVLALMRADGIVGYKNIITIEVENIGQKTLEGVEIIEGIPKEMVENAAFIESDSNHYIIDADHPILKFFLENLEPGEKKTVEYSFERNPKQGPITEEMFNAMEAPITLLQMQPEDQCMGVLCNDFDPCTRDYCVEGKCTSAPMKEEAKCGKNMVCMQGKCVPAKPDEKEMPEMPLTTKEGMIAIILLLGAIALGLTARITVRKWKKGKGFGK